VVLANRTLRLHRAGARGGCAADLFPLNRQRRLPAIVPYGVLFLENHDYREICRCMHPMLRNSLPRPSRAISDARCPCSASPSGSINRQSSSGITVNQIAHRSLPALSLVPHQPQCQMTGVDTIDDPHVSLGGVFSVQSSDVLRHGSLPRNVAWPAPGYRAADGRSPPRPAFRPPGRFGVRRMAVDQDRPSARPVAWAASGALCRDWDRSCGRNLLHHSFGWPRMSDPGQFWQRPCPATSGRLLPSGADNRGPVVRGRAEICVHRSEHLRPASCCCVHLPGRWRAARPCVQTRPDGGPSV